MASRRGVALVLALGLVAAGCGSGDDDEGAAETTTSAAGSVTTAGGAATTAVGDDLPTSMEGWEALWAEERAAVVAAIEAGGWGRSADGKQLTGPDGFTIDLGACPAGWSDTQGLTDTQITIGMPLPQSGPNAEAGAIGSGEDAVYRYYSDQGAFVDVEGKTRTVELEMRDDGYDPARTIPLVDELIDSVGAFAVVTLGSPSTLRTYDKLNDRCVPQLLPASGHPALGDPVNHPWTTSSSISYATEAVMWGAFIESRLDELGGKAKIVGLRMSNDFGASYDAALKNYLATSDHKDDIDYTSITFEPAAASLKDEMTTLAAEDADMFIGMSTGASCTQMITEAALNGMAEDVPYRFMSSACKATTPVTRDKLGDDADGWWSVGGGLKDVLVAAYDDDAFVVAARQMIADAGYKLSPSFNLGLYYGWTIAQGLQIAGQLDGGLTRSNLILALRSIDMTNPMLLGGLRINMRGNADAYLLEGSDISSWDAANQAWVQDSLTDLTGETPNCAWDPAVSRCA
jgi:branched-chain amino acid transport system substrate-binding protein